MFKCERIENLYYKGELTGYRYMGALETCRTLYEFEENDGSITLDNILKKDNYKKIQPNDYCEECGYFNECKRKDDLLDDSLECKDESFFDLDKDMNQKVFYYNEKLNSAVIFSVDGDICCDRDYFDSVDNLLRDIYEGVNSPYSKYLIDDFEEIAEGLKLKDNLMYIRYINAEGFVDNNVIVTLCSLEGKKIYSIVDLISILYKKGNE